MAEDDLEVLLGHLERDVPHCNRKTDGETSHNHILRYEKSVARIQLFLPKTLRMDLSTMDRSEVFEELFIVQLVFKN